MKRRWIWVLALGIAVCLALFVFLTLGRKEPSFAEQITMLKGLRPTSDDTELGPEVNGVRVPVKTRTQEYKVRGGFRDVCLRMDREFAGKWSHIWPGSSEWTYEFGTPDQADYRMLWVTRDEENETMVSVLECSPLTWADRVNVWWARSRDRKP